MSSPTPALLRALVLGVAGLSQVWPAQAQRDLGSLEITRAGELIDFHPDELPEHRIWQDRRGESRLLVGWRKIDSDTGHMIVAQLAGLADREDAFGLMLVIQQGGRLLNYSSGCSLNSRRTCDPASYGLVLDLEGATLTVQNAEFKRDSLGDGPEADERIRASGVLRLIGTPERP